jgi:hypothetical protein
MWKKKKKLERERERERERELCSQVDNVQKSMYK